MSSLKIRKVGNSLGVILPKEIQEALQVSEGDVIDFTTIDKNKILLKSHLPHHSQWKFKNVELSQEDQQWIDADLEDNDDESSEW